MPFNVCPSCKVYNDPRTDVCGACGHIDAETKQAIVSRFAKESSELAKDLLAGPLGWVPADLTCTRCGSKETERTASLPFQRALSGVVRCKACGHREGMMSHIARAAFPVERMPEGARPIYDKDPGVAEIVAPKILHIKEFSEWNSGPDIRKCTDCGVRLWIPSDGEWTDVRAVWESPPEGYVSCKSAREGR